MSENVNGNENENENRENIDNNSGRKISSDRKGQENQQADRPPQEQELQKNVGFQTEIRQLSSSECLEVQRIINLIDGLKMNEISSQRLKELQEIIFKHITPHIHPKQISRLGSLLLSNGKFVVFFIKMMANSQKTDYLEKYLFNYFKQVGRIEKQKQSFEDCYMAIFDSRRNEKKTMSPASSKKQANWSTKVERDTNSVLEGDNQIEKLSSIHGSQQKGSGNVINLKRVQRIAVKQHSEDEERERNQTKQEKGSRGMNARKTKNKMQGNGKRNQSNHKKTKSKQKDRNGPASEILYPKENITSVSSRSNKKQLNSILKQEKQNAQKTPRSKNSKQLLQLLKSQADVSFEKALQPLGSCYKYEVVPDKKNDGIELRQRRTSARLKNKDNQRSPQKSAGFEKARPSSVKKSTRKSKQAKRTKKRMSNASSTEKGSSRKSEKQERRDSQLKIDWIKDHLKQIKLVNILLSVNFNPLTQEDKKITKLLEEIQNNEQLSQSLRSNHQKELSIPNQLNLTGYQEDSDGAIRVPEQQNTINENQISQRKFEEIKKSFQIDHLPIIIQSIIDPDINDHGIYALVKFAKITQFDMGTPFAVTPLTCKTMFSKKHIKEDLVRVRELAGKYKDNVGYIPKNEQILRMVCQAKAQRDRQKITN